MTLVNRSFILAIGLIATHACCCAEPISQAALAKTPFMMAKSPVDVPKRRFIAKLLPIIEQVNQQLLATRNTLQNLPLQHLSTEQQQLLTQLAHQYHLADAPPAQQCHALLQHIDIVPPSLVLAQAADESAWGRSRFATQGNNLFGQWCYTDGCGMVPYRRVKGLHHQVRVFSSVDQSVIAYIHNINVSPQYALLRTLRQQMRIGQRPWSGLVLAQGLGHYSARGQAYVREIQGIIRANHLQRFDQPFAQSEPPPSAQ